MFFTKLLENSADAQVNSKYVNLLFFIFSIMVVVGIGMGLYGFVEGHHNVYNNTREMPWGILISGYAFFAIVSTGLCLLAAISHIFGGNDMAPLANRMVWLSIITILSGFSLIGLELESPWRMALYNIISPNPTSNIWWMGTLYGIAVGLMLLEFFLILSRRFSLAIGLGVVGALAEIAANTNLGAVFATMAGRPFWYGSQIPIYFIGNAFLAGAAAAIFFTIIAHRIRSVEPTPETLKGIGTAGKIMFLMVIMIFVSTTWKIVSHLVGGSELGTVAVDVLLSGPLSFNFWILDILIGMHLPIILLIYSKMTNLRLLLTSSIMVLVGLFVRLYDLVVAGQTVPVYYDIDRTATILSYAPSLGEFIVVFGGIGMTGFLFILGERFFGKAYITENH